MLLRIITLAFAALLFQASTAWTSPLYILFDQANPPFMYAADSKAVGIYPAIIAEAFARMGSARGAGGAPLEKGAHLHG